jgi:hypothetical protein
VVKKVVKKGLFDVLWRYGAARVAEKLPDTLRAKILAYIDAPDMKKWKEIRDEKIHRAVSLHDAVDEVDRCYPGFYPSGILVARALRHRQRVEELAGLLLPPK